MFGASLAVVSPDGSRVSGIGTPTDHTYLLGSVGKAFNGLIYSAMVAEGLVRPQDTLDQFLPLDGTAAGRATLESLLTHTSGLPSTGGGRRTSLRITWRLLHGLDPQPETLDDLVVQLRAAPARPGHFDYSNLGGSALGHALAKAAGTSYPELVADRLAGPVGRPTIHVPSPGDTEGPRDAHGLSVVNRSQEQWTGEGYAPAGGIRASAEDMSVLMERMLNDPLPGWQNAFTPLFRNDSTDSVRIGAGWMLQPNLAWHNGAASGFCSVVVLDREARRGASISVIDGTMQADLLPVALELLR